LIPAQSALMSRVEFAGHSLFIPFFLISVGMLVDPSVLASDPRTWLVAASMVVAVVGTKWAAAFLARHWFGYSRDEGNVMFGLSVVQAAATLAAVLVGYRLKIVDVSVLNGAIAMIMVTCPLGSWMVDRYGRRMAAGGPERVAPVRADQRLLVSVANPASATELLDLAFLLRNPDRPGAIHPVAFVPDEGETADAVANGEKLLSLCLAHAAAADAEVHPSVRVGLNAGPGENRARLQLDLVGDPVIANGAVTFQHHAIDDRVLFDLHHHGRAIDRNVDVGKQIGREQRLDRQIDQAWVGHLARLNQDIGQDGGGFDPLVAAHQNLQHGALGGGSTRRDRLD